MNPQLNLNIQLELAPWKRLIADRNCLYLYCIYIFPLSWLTDCDLIKYWLYLWGTYVQIHWSHCARIQWSVFLAPHPAERVAHTPPARMSSSFPANSDPALPTADSRPGSDPTASDGTDWTAKERKKASTKLKSNSKFGLKIIRNLLHMC